MTGRGKGSRQRQLEALARLPFPRSLTIVLMPILDGCQIERIVSSSTVGSKLCFAGSIFRVFPLSESLLSNLGRALKTNL